LIETADESEIRIMAVGDIMLGMAYPRSIAQVENIPNKLKEDSNTLIDKKVQNLFEKADVVFGNLECVISEGFDENYEKSLMDFPNLIMAPPEAVNFLDNNFSHLNIANNHILDHGIDKAKETVDFLENSKVNYVGKPTFWERNFSKTSIKGKKIGLMGFSLYVPDRTSGKNLSEYRTTKEFSGLDDEIPEKRKLKENIVEEIKERKTEVDFLVISLHWGVPQTIFPSNNQIEFGRKLIDEGADLVLGHGPHIFQPVEIYKEKVIAYSLGNFIFDMWSEKNLKSGILDLRITEDNNLKVEVIPIIQKDLRVCVDSNIEEIEEMIVEDFYEYHDSDEFKEKNKKIRRDHYKGFVWQYVKNSYNLPLGYHKYVLSNWISKVYNKLF